MQDKAQDMLNAMAETPMDAETAARIQKEDMMAQQTSGLIVPAAKGLVHADKTLVDAQGRPIKAEEPAVEPKFPLPPTWSRLLARKRELTDALNKALPENTSIQFNSQTPDVLPTFWNPQKQQITVDEATMNLTLEFINLEGIYKFYERIGALKFLPGAQITGFDKQGFPIVKLAPSMAAKLKRHNMSNAQQAAKKAKAIRDNAPRTPTQVEKRKKRKDAKKSRQRNRG